MDASGREGDEGHGVAAISLGESLSRLWSGDFRMGKPIRRRGGYLCLNS